MADGSTDMLKKKLRKSGLKAWLYLLPAILFLGAFMVLASLANWAFDYNYMFLVRHDGTPYVIFWDLVGGNQPLYAIVVIALFLIYIVVFYAVYGLIAQTATCAQKGKDKNLSRGKNQ